MNQEITAQDVRAWRRQNGWTLAELGDALGGLDTAQVSRMESGARRIAPAEQRLLQILIRRELPADIAGGFSGDYSLIFNALEWEIIGNIARRAGLQPQEWIAAKIREYLAVYDVASGIRYSDAYELKTYRAADADAPAPPDATGTDAAGP